MLVRVAMALVVTAALIFILVKYRADEENNFTLKLAGYFILGTFRSSVFGVSVPLGFIVFLLFFRPKLNKTAKKKAALLGFIIYIAGLLMTYVFKIK